MKKLALLAAAAAAAAGCASIPARPSGAQRDVEVFKSGRPTRPYTEVCRLSVYTEKTRSGEPRLEDALPEVKRRARLCGADAIVDVDWDVHGASEAIIYHVKAVGIAFAQPGQSLGPAKERDIEVLGPGDPRRPFTKTCNLDLYVEKTSTGEPTLSDVLPELKRQARLCGANGVVDVQWTLGGSGEAKVYHVTATGVVFAD